MDGSISTTRDERPVGAGTGTSSTVFRKTGTITTREYNTVLVLQSTSTMER
jgi:hypothetical protein